MAHSHIKRQWHKKHKTYVFEHFKGVCQSCKHTINKSTTKFDIHHIHYDINKTPIKGKKLYEVDAKILLIYNVITLLCRPCHDLVHTAKDPNNPKHLENKSECNVCGKIEKGIFGRKNQQKLDCLLCRKCFLNQKRHIVNQLSLF